MINMTLQSMLLVVFHVLLFLIFSMNGSVYSVPCNQTCPGSLRTRLPFPFGFSEGCQIRLNCTESGKIWIGDYQVQKITEDGIWVSVPADCNRRIGTLRQLYSENYAPSLQNILVLLNCSHTSVNGCQNIDSRIANMLMSGNCDDKNRFEVSCMSDGFKPVSDLLKYAEDNGTDCQILFSGIEVKQAWPRAEVITLLWWLDGPCQCSHNAHCLYSSLPNGKTGYQCGCNKGYKGEGYPGSLGCREDGLRKMIIISVVLTVVLLFGLSLALCIWCKKGKFEPNQNELRTNHDYPEGDLKLPLFDLASIIKATKNFSTNNKLGEGGYGPVYKGVLEDGREVAVKTLSKSSRQGNEEFKNEVCFIAKLQHRNLVKLLGCCIEEDEKMLIYEYLPNNSLDSFIFDSKRGEKLDWPKRVKIIDGIIRGLIYLHQDSRLRIVHRDLKASNILLDTDMNPKISDFGLARCFGGNETEGNTNRVVGTHGYMPPEYVMDGTYSIKSDVFSFGVLVLEIISGKRNRGFCHKEHCLNLLVHAWRLHMEGRCLELVDASVEDSYDKFEVVRLVHVGLLCVQHSPEDRPSMSAVVVMLGSEGALPCPEQPGFYIKRDILEAKSSSGSRGSYCATCSLNDVTMTPLQAR